MMTHRSSDQKTLIDHSSRTRRGVATWIARLLALCMTAALVVGCGNSSAPPRHNSPRRKGPRTARGRH